MHYPGLQFETFWETTKLHEEFCICIKWLVIQSWRRELSCIKILAACHNAVSEHLSPSNPCAVRCPYGPETHAETVPHMTKVTPDSTHSGDVLYILEAHICTPTKEKKKNCEGSQPSFHPIY